MMPPGAPGAGIHPAEAILEQLAQLPPEEVARIVAEYQRAKQQAMQGGERTPPII